MLPKSHATVSKSSQVGWASVEILMTGNQLETLNSNELHQCGDTSLKLG